MLVHIPNILPAATLIEVRALLAELSFDPGRKTAGWHAREVKSNDQAAPGPALDRLRTILATALSANEVVRAMALPVRILPPLISRTGPGQGYGTHVDDAFMGSTNGLRTDLSVTIFLSDPASYDGGELVAETPSGEDAVKFPAGDAVLYPSTTLHRVETVTRGERLVAVTWIESRVRDAAAREILFDLDRARRALFAKDGKSDAFDLVSKSYSNLLRRWGGR